MCGISGFILVEQDTQNTIKRMCDLIRHRGPNDEGYVLFESLDSAAVAFGGEDTPLECYSQDFPFLPKKNIGNIGHMSCNMALGHRRLSIIDTSYAGHQPMCTVDKNIWIVFNGEIYNYLELREELEGLGRQFLTNTDTEVIVASYERWGISCLQKFNGMFAILIVDKKQKKMFAARDRFGIKPLYYWMNGNGVFFASEIKQFQVVPGWQPRANTQMVYDFLTQGLLDHSSDTMFEGVKQLRGGEFLQIDLSMGLGELVNSCSTGAVRPVKWYILKPKYFDGDYGTACEKFRELFLDAVSLHLRSDVPVGSCLSGGLDSSSIVRALESMSIDSEVSHNTFSAYSEVKRFDESEYIKEVVKNSRINGHFVYPDLHHLFNELGTITWHQDEPFGSTSIFAQWEVFKLAAKHEVKVMLDGQGADEQLAGYKGFFSTRFAGLFSSGQWLNLLREIEASKRIHGITTQSALMGMLNMLLPNAILQPLAKIIGKSPLEPKWLNMDALNVKRIDPVVGLGGKTSSIQQLSTVQLTATSVPMLLHWEDRDSMAFSIESRVPFLDYRLVEFVLGLQEEYKHSGGITKRVLRDSMKGILPEKIRMRMDKLGFATAEEVWMTQREPLLFKEKIQESKDLCGELFSRDRIVELTFDIIDGKRPFTFLPWRVISLGEWAKQFNVSFK